MRAAAAALVACVVTGCAAWTPPQTAALRAGTPAGLPERVELTSVPFIAQTPLHCGPASLAMVLRHIGRDVSADQLADAVFLPARAGSLQTEMLAGARRHDAVAQQLPGQLEALLREVQAGHPVVVLQNLGLAIAPAWHYAVLIGYDRRRDVVLLRSGLAERVAMPLPTFEHTWARGGHWAMVALPPGESAAADDERAATDAAVAFERVAAPASAARAYGALLRRWPANLAAAVGLGHARLAQGDAAGAEAAWRQAAERHDSAAAWNNLAMLRWQRGDPAGARAALTRALRRTADAEPAFAAAVQATQRTIDGAAEGAPRGAPR